MARIIPESCFLCQSMLWRSRATCLSCSEALWLPELIFSEKEGLPFFSLFHYTKESSPLIRLCKKPYRNQTNQVLARILAEKLSLECTSPLAGVVPMPPKVFGNRDHAHVIAKVIADFLKLPVFGGVLERVPRSEELGGCDLDQKMKSRDQRLKTKIILRDSNAWQLQMAEFNKNEILILADDVTTSGATLVQAWKALGQTPAIGVTLASRPLLL